MLSALFLWVRRDDGAELELFLIPGEKLSLLNTRTFTLTRLPLAAHSCYRPACFSLLYPQRYLKRRSWSKTIVDESQAPSCAPSLDVVTLNLYVYLSRSNPISLFTPLIWLYRCSPVHISLLLYLQIFPSVPLFTPLSVLPLSRFISLLSCHCLHLSSHLYLFIHLPIHTFICISLCQCLFLCLYLRLSFYFLSFTRSVHHQFPNLFVFPPLPPSVPLSNVPIVMKNLAFFFIWFFRSGKVTENNVWKSYGNFCSRCILKKMQVIKIFTFSIWWKYFCEWQCV